MRSCDLPDRAGETTFGGANRYEHLLLFNMNVSHDGFSTEFDVLLSNEKTIIANIPHWEIDAVISQLQHASDEMRKRQRMTLHNSAETLRNLCRNAHSPSKSELFIDPLNGEIIYLHSFANHAPVAIRMTPTGLKILRAKTNAALSRLAN